MYKCIFIDCIFHYKINIQKSQYNNEQGYINKHTDVSKQEDIITADRQLLQLYTNNNIEIILKCESIAQV